MIGDDRLVFGTNFSGWDAPEDMTSHLPAEKLADNARKLLRFKKKDSTQ
jgi:aminocarboxymuconate-semialdehyde decarboxylase